MEKKAAILVRSHRIFDGVHPHPYAGSVAVGADGSILFAGQDDGAAWLSPSCKVYELGERLVCPGFIDVHCFFAGHAWSRAGVDLSAAKTAEQMLRAAQSHAASLPDDLPVLGHGWDGEAISSLPPSALEEAFETRPVALFAAGNERCWMNKAAEKTFGFAAESCSSEGCWRVIRMILQDEAFILPAFQDYMAMMNRRGITAIKEMGFDDYYGFVDILRRLETAGKLSLRVHFMSQPVGAPLDLPFGKTMREKLKGPFLRFSGYNRMTDGSISQHEGDIKRPYRDRPESHCALDIDYAAIEKETLAVDAEGFRFSLHAQGDAAIEKVLRIYEKCRRDEEGRLVNRHSITDLEFSDPADIRRMGALAAIAEIYPQIPSLYSREEKLAVIDQKLGRESRSGYWNRRAMEDAGVILSCGTDLPLLYDDIPASIYHACGALFPEGGEPFNPQNALRIDELLRAWTAGGAYNLYREGEIGTLEAGKRADIAVLDADVFALPMDRMRDVNVCLTLVDGKEVHSTL